MRKYVKIYCWQAISIVFNFAAVFVVTPYISANPDLYGIYSIVIAAYLFISYADFGFLSAGMKYAAESYAQKNIKNEIEVIGFSGMVFLVFASVYALGVFIISYNPSLLVRGINNVDELMIARKLLILLAFSVPILVFQRIIQIIYGVRLQDYKFQRVLIVSNIIKLLSVFLFFGNGKYLIVEYFFFSQLCMLIAVLTGFLMIHVSLDYDIVLLFKSFKFSKKLFKKTRKLAFTTIFLTLCWILYYELDTFAIAKIFGAKQVAIYAIGLTIITYFRSLFGVIFTPFVARFNHFVGLGDTLGLQQFFIKVMVIFLPVTVFPVIAVFLTTQNFIFTWVGEVYTSSVSVAQFLVLCYIFSFITYPSGILIMANERVKALYFTSALQPVVFWSGILITYRFLGLQSFAYFKFLAFFLETIVYTIIILNFLNIKIQTLFKKIMLPALIPLILMILSLLLVRPYLPLTIGKINMLYYFLSIGIIVLMGVVCYYFTSKIFKEYVNKLGVEYLSRRSFAVPKI